MCRGRDKQSKQKIHISFFPFSSSAFIRLIYIPSFHLLFCTAMDFAHSSIDASPPTFCSWTHHFLLLHKSNEMSERSREDKHAATYSADIMVIFQSVEHKSLLNICDVSSHWFLQSRPIKPPSSLLPAPLHFSKWLFDNLAAERTLQSRFFFFLPQQLPEEADVAACVGGVASPRENNWHSESVTERWRTAARGERTHLVSFSFFSRPRRTLEQI